MSSVLKSFGHAQLLLAQVILRQKQQTVQIWQPGSVIRDEPPLIEYLQRLIEQADLTASYSASLQSLLNSRTGGHSTNASLDDHCKAVTRSILFLTPKKHVVFLGAGASASAGYPLGNRLADLMKEPNQLRKEVQKCLQLSGMVLEQAHKACDEIFNPFIRIFEEPLRLFKGSGYPTIDHFSREARSGRFREAVQQLKRLVRLILSLPGNHDFSLSDYHHLIDKLFTSGGSRLREDVTIITFNYDFCLQHRLYERLQCRNQISPVYDVGELFSHHSSINGGLGSWPEISWSKKRQLTILQLHGSIAYPIQNSVGGKIVFGELLQEEFFSNNLTNVLARLASPDMESPPLAFPFEIFDETGSFVSASEFPLERPNQFAARENLHEMFCFLWNHARREVQSADRISFAGVSLHPFLEPGLRFLFKGKHGPTQMVIANPENLQFTADHPNSLSSRTMKFLSDTTGSKMESLLSANDTSQSDDLTKRKGLTTYSSFADFICREL